MYYYRDKSGNNRVDSIYSLLISKISSLDKPHVYLHECSYIGCPVKNGLLKNYEKMMQRKWGKTQPSGVINLFLIDLVKITREFILPTFPNSYFEDGNRYFCKALIYSRRKIINSYFNFYIYTIWMNTYISTFFQIQFFTDWQIFRFSFPVCN